MPSEMTTPPNPFSMQANGASRRAMPLPSREVWDAWKDIRPFEPPYEDFDYTQLSELLQRWSVEHTDRVALSRAGTTYEGRAIWTLKLGKGPLRILVWSRQHGNEPICTAGLLHALSYLLHKPGEKVVRDILNGATILVLPMVNPDGVERFTRRNAMGIDVNRDARRGATPEGAALLLARDEFKPHVHFNLHDMGARKSTSTEGRLVALAFQAGPFDEWEGDNEVRLFAKRLCSRMTEAVGDYAYGHVTKYDARFMPTAFGDAMMGWGVASCLIESGGWFGPETPAFVTRLHYLALLAGLHAAASGSVYSANPALYDSLPLDTGRTYADLLLRGAVLADGSSMPCFVADVSINRAAPERNGILTAEPMGKIEDLGDLTHERGKMEQDLADHLLTPGWVGFAPGVTINTPEDAAALVPFLEAGFTTVAGACGPFVNDAAFEAWHRTLDDESLPTHFVAFELVDSVAEALKRHGQSRTAGLLIRNLHFCPEAFLRLLHLYHPAAQSAVPDEQADLQIAVDLYLQATGNLRRNRIIAVARPLGRRPPTAEGEYPIIGPPGVDQLVRDFIRHPDQISVAVDPIHEKLGLMPTPPLLSGVTLGRVPPRTYIGELLATLNCVTEDHLAITIARLTRQPAQALGWTEVGMVRCGYRADLAALPLAEIPTLEDVGRSAVSTTDPAEPVQPLRPVVQFPTHVVVGGHPAYVEQRPTQMLVGTLIVS